MLTPESPKVEKYWSKVTHHLPCSGTGFLMKLKWDQHTGAARVRALRVRGTWFPPQVSFLPAWTEPWFPHLEIEDNCAYFAGGPLGELNVLLYAKHLVQNLAYSKQSIILAFL